MKLYTRISSVRFVFFAILFSSQLARTQIDKRADHFLKSITAQNEPGLTALVLKNSKVMHRKSYGLARVENSMPINENTLFQLASTSKQFTAFAIALLIDDGKIQLEDPIRKILPELPTYLDTVRLKNLIYHTSGLPDYYSQSDLCFRKMPATNEDVIWFLRKFEELNFTPGEKFEYSNTGYALLALIIEKVSGLKYRAFLKRRIFDPLNMHSTFVSIHMKPKDSEVALSYFGRGTGLGQMPFSSCEKIVGDGGVYSSSNDMQKWLLSLSNARLLSESKIRDVIFKSGLLNDKTETGYAFGWFVERAEDGTELIHHGGSWLGYHHSLVFLPASQVWSLVLTNHDEYGPPARWEIASGLYDLFK